jgi:tRNA pseudouridine38-40 synthase
MRFRLTIEYDGTEYSGWQLQNGQASIQGQLEAALARLFGVSVRVYGAGRTDAGVHALGQVAAFETPRPIDCAELRRALNALLPRDIAIVEAGIAQHDFDPRRDAVTRTYDYRILTRTSRSAFAHRYSWLVNQPLDLTAMKQAAAHFLGEHDFAAFRSLGSDERTTVRRVVASDWRAEAELLTYRIEGTAFLRHMVRTMVGLMVEVGRGKLTSWNASEILESRDRAMAPAAAPPGGLFLVNVRYRGD